MGAAFAGPHTLARSGAAWLPLRSFWMRGRDEAAPPHAPRSLRGSLIRLPLRSFWMRGRDEAAPPHAPRSLRGSLIRLPLRSFPPFTPLQRGSGGSILRAIVIPYFELPSLQ